MKMLRIHVLTVLLTIAGSTFADNVLKVANTTMAPGDAATLSVTLENEAAMIAFEMWLQLPEGLSIATDEDDDFEVTRSSTRLGKHELLVSRNNDGRYHFLCYSSTNKTIKGSSGELMGIKMVCDADAQPGTYNATFQNIIFSDENKVRVILPECAFSITVSRGTSGDVNRDGSVTIADVTALVNIILGKDSAEPHQYDHAAADVNGDGSITIADVTALVNIILGK